MLFSFRAGGVRTGERRSSGRCTTGRTERNVRQKTTADVQERGRGTTATRQNPTLSYAEMGRGPLIGAFPPAAFLVRVPPAERGSGSPSPGCRGSGFVPSCCEEPATGPAGRAPEGLHEPATGRSPPLPARVRRQPAPGGGHPAHVPARRA